MYQCLTRRPVRAQNLHANALANAPVLFSRSRRFSPSHDSFTGVMNCQNNDQRPLFDANSAIRIINNVVATSISAANCNSHYSARCNMISGRNEAFGCVNRSFVPYTSNTLPRIEEEEEWFFSFPSCGLLDLQSHVMLIFFLNPMVFCCNFTAF